RRRPRPGGRPPRARRLRVRQHPRLRGGPGVRDGLPALPGTVAGRRRPGRQLPDPPHRRPRLPPQRPPHLGPQRLVGGPLRRRRVPQDRGIDRRHPVGRPVRSVTPKRRRPAAAVLLGLAIVGATFLVHNAASSSQAGGDSAWTTYQSLSLLRHHTLELTEWQDVLNRFPIHWHDNDRHKPVYNFPWGTSVVSAPIVGVIALGDKVGGHSLAADIRAHFAPHHLEKAVASVWVALTTGLVFAFAFRARRSLWVAAIVAVVFAFATSAFSTM